MLKSVLRKLWGQKNKPETGILPADPISDAYTPQHGSFFQTLEYPLTGEDNKTTIGKTWMEAGLNAQTGKWVLWSMSVKEMDNALTGDKDFVRNNRVLFDATSFDNAYQQMTTMTEAMAASGTKPLKNKSRQKLGADHFKQFAWREGLMMSRSGRLYPVNDDLIAANNFFNLSDLNDAEVFNERYQKEKFTEVPITLPSTNWEKSYSKDKKNIDERLRALYNRYGNDVNSFEMAQQIIAHERPEILYAYLQGSVLKESFNPKIFENDAQKHYLILIAAIERTTIEPLSLLSNAGLDFKVRYNEETPVERALRSKKYSHLHIMLGRDGTELANYADESGITPAMQAIQLKDDQAFRMIHLEGIDYSQASDDGWFLIHHAFDHNFTRGIYAWVDEGLPINHTIKGSNFTGVSIAKRNKNQALLKFAQKLGANLKVEPLKEAPAQKEEKQTSSVTEKLPVEKFDIEILNSSLTNEQIKQSVEEYISQNGNLNITDSKGMSIFEICWKNHNTSDNALDRRELISFFGSKGLDPSTNLRDGTTVLTRAASNRKFDLDFIAAISPFVKDVNNTDKNNNNIMHAMQLNANDQVGHSKHIKAVLKLFPNLDLNQQNNMGYSNIGLAIRLNRTNTLKEFIKSLVINDKIADLSQTTSSNWSYLDIAFTSAFHEEKGKNFPVWANKINDVSEKLQNTVLGMVNRVMTDGDASQKNDLFSILNRTRPDNNNLASAIVEAECSNQIINGLRAWGMKTPQSNSTLTKQPK